MIGHELIMDPDAGRIRTVEEMEWWARQDA
jgi:hypothetical protein